MCMKSVLFCMSPFSRLCRQRLRALSPRLSRDHCPSSVSARYGCESLLQIKLKYQQAQYFLWCVFKMFLRLNHISLSGFFTAFFRGGRCNSPRNVSPQLCGTRWARAHSARLFAGSQLSRIRGEGGGGAEETAWRVTNCNNSWRQKGQVSAMCFFLYSSCRLCLVVVGECFLLFCWCCFKYHYS